jgi:hypothetical protein
VNETQTILESVFVKAILAVVVPEVLELEGESAKEEVVEGAEEGEWEGEGEETVGLELVLMEAFKVMAEEGPPHQEGMIFRRSIANAPE